MGNLEIEKYLNIVNEEKKRKELNTYIPLYPMLRIEHDQLYVGVLLTKEEDNVWDKNEKVKAEYWTLIDIDSNNILEFNETTNKDFVIGKLVEKNTDTKQKEMSEYTVKKTLQYKNYLIEDIKNEQLPLQKKLSNILDSKIEIDKEVIEINDYVISHLESDIKEKVDELVNMLVISKYGSITFYYYSLFNQIINEYKRNKFIDKEKIKLCSEIMNNYYDGVIGIDNFFNYM